MKLGPGQRALVVGAHPDDAEFGCFGALQRFASKDVVVLTCGEHGGPASRRRDEAGRAAALVGATITIADQPDTALAAGPAIAAVADAVARTRPDVVFCPSRQDDHQDHAVAAHAAHVATRGWSGLLLGYLTPSAVARFRPQAFVALDDEEWATKRGALAVHESQSHRSYLSEDYLDTTGRYWALQAGGQARWAEPFEVVRWIDTPVP